MSPSLVDDALSRRTSMTLSNGTVASYAYDPASQLTSLVHDLSGSPVASFTYTYGAVGGGILGTPYVILDSRIAPT